MFSYLKQRDGEKNWFIELPHSKSDSPKIQLETLKDFTSGGGTAVGGY